MNIIEVPFQQIPKEQLIALIEEFITREGTDYGFEECTVSDQVQRAMAQLSDKQIKVFFNIDSNDVFINVSDCMLARS